MEKEAVIALRMERQCLKEKAGEKEYLSLYRDTQPGQNVYWSGFGQPPVLSFRAGFDDLEYNRVRQLKRELIKGRFAGGTLGWILREELELFAALYRKPLTTPTDTQLRILALIEESGPMNIQQIKEETGLLVKAITPALHRLQEAFLIYEDQYDGAWDRGWYRFSEIFPNAALEKYTKTEALKIILARFAYRLVWFDTAMAKSFYRLPEKEIRLAAEELEREGVLLGTDGGFILRADMERLESGTLRPEPSVYALHRSDFLYKTHEHIVKKTFKPLYEKLPYDHEPLQYLLIDGVIHGAVVGHFRYGPYDLNDVVCDLPDARERREEILEAVKAVNDGNRPKRFQGEPL